MTAAAAPRRAGTSGVYVALLLLMCSSARPSAGARLDAETVASGPWVIGGDNSNYSYMGAPNAGRGGRGYFTGRGGGRFVVRGGDGRFVVRGGRGRSAYLGTFGRGRGSGGEFTRFGRGDAAGQGALANGTLAEEGSGIRSHLEAECVSLKGAISCHLDQDCEPVFCTNATDSRKMTDDEHNETKYSAQLLQGVIDAWMASEGNGCRIRESVVHGPSACGIELFPLTAE